MMTDIFSWLSAPFVGTYSPRETTDSEEYKRYQEEFGYKKQQTLFNFPFYSSESEEDA